MITYRTYLVVFAIMLLPMCIAPYLASHLDINHTTSLPRGVYWREPISKNSIQRNDIVIACMPQPFLAIAKQRKYLEQGECFGAEPVMKLVIGQPGDLVTLTPSGVSINHRYVDHSALFAYDHDKRRIPHVPYGEYHLQSGQYWLGTPNPHGFDSRYYGPVTDIRYRAYPVFLIDFMQPMN